jgi:hypothetical protein
MGLSATFSAQPDAAALLAQAEYETGLHDFGDRRFRGPLEALVAFLSAGGLGADDRRAALGQVVRVLGGRCWMSPTRNTRPSNHTSC